MTPYIGPIMHVVTIMASMTLSSRHSTYPPKASRMDFTMFASSSSLRARDEDASSSPSSSMTTQSSPQSSSDPSGVVVVGDGTGAGCRSAQPPLLDMGGRHMSLNTEFRRRPVLSIRSSTLLVDFFVRIK
jgi:hypothetical protein